MRSRARKREIGERHHYLHHWSTSSLPSSFPLALLEFLSHVTKKWLKECYLPLHKRSLKIWALGLSKRLDRSWDVEAELENIKNTLSTIQAVLQDAAEQQSHNHQVRDWLEKLKDAVYEADDLLSEFLTEALRRGGTSENIAKKVRGFFSSSNPLVFRYDMSCKIKAMRQKLNAIAEDRKKFHLKECHVEPHVSMDREETHSFVPNENVFGREDDKKAIIKLLLDPNVEENVSVVPIVGIGGLGKTTLAQYVYNDDIVKKHFELKMWVCVSDPFEVKVVVEKIIASATSNKPNDLHMDELQKQLRNKIDGKKYLLVLDDVWNQNYNKWDNLKSLLMGGAKGKLPRGIRELVNLRHLYNTYCNKLSHMPRGLGQLTCLQTLPSFIVSNDPPSISNHVGGLGELNRLNNLRGTLEIKHLERLEDAGDKRCDEFDPLSDVGAEDDGMEWRHLNCLHTLCFSKLPKLESLPAGLQRVTTLKNLTISDCPNLICLPEWISEFTSLEYLQFTRCAPNLTSLPDVISCLKSLKKLRIVGFPNLTTFPEWISNFTSLEKLEIEECPNLTSLPDGICYLRFLRHLRIQDCLNLTTFPERIGELTSLQRLEISKCPNLTSLPDGMHGLSSLQSLEIIRCPNLTSLPDGMHCLRCPNLTSLPDGMHGLSSLQTLRIAEYFTVYQSKQKGLRTSLLQQTSTSSSTTLSLSAPRTPLAATSVASFASAI
uniref:Rx N-terminal domain-containing protein n=1 Tax=Fagus sylvatica TaxID=28930 RepID=A0A2N9J2T6_FAGSY